jgi:rhodanese-related sulfurtransferase
MSQLTLHSQQSPPGFIFSKISNVKKAVAVLFFTISFFLFTKAQNPVNWTKDQLLEPHELASVLTSGKKLPAIFSVGPGASIPQSKDASIVLYCGCCPFENCPNVRPAIALLKDSGYTNYKLLNLPSNLKKDWIDKGYPTVKP